MPGDDDGDATANRAVATTTAVLPAPATGRGGQLLLAPNPSTGEVRVGYGLPQAARTVRMRVFDEWGRPADERALTADALSEGVVLRLRPGLYHCQLIADEKVVATERLLIAR